MQVLLFVFITIRSRDPIITKGQFGFH